MGCSRTVFRWVPGYTTHGPGVIQVHGGQGRARYSGGLCGQVQPLQVPPHGDQQPEPGHSPVPPAPNGPVCTAMSRRNSSPSLRIPRWYEYMDECICWYGQSWYSQKYLLPSVFVVFSRLAHMVPDARPGRSYIATGPPCSLFSPLISRRFLSSSSSCPSFTFTPEQVSYIHSSYRHSLTLQSFPFIVYTRQPHC